MTTQLADSYFNFVNKSSNIETTMFIAGCFYGLLELDSTFLLNHPFKSTYKIGACGGSFIAFYSLVKYFTHPQTKHILLPLVFASTTFFMYKRFIKKQLVVDNQ